MTAEPMDARLAVLEQQMSNHVKAQYDANERLVRGLDKLEVGQTELAKKIEASARRIHGRIDRLSVGVLGTVIVFLVGVCGWMATYWGPWAD